jgi:hypothetical protein
VARSSKTSATVTVHTLSHACTDISFKKKILWFPSNKACWHAAPFFCPQHPWSTVKFEAHLVMAFKTMRKASVWWYCQCLTTAPGCTVSNSKIALEANTKEVIVPSWLSPHQPPKRDHVERPTRQGRFCHQRSSTRSIVPVKQYNKKTVSIYCAWSDLDSNEDLCFRFYRPVLCVQKYYQVLSDLMPSICVRNK